MAAVSNVSGSGLYGHLDFGGERFEYVDIGAAAANAGVSIKTMPYTIRVLLENAVRKAGGNLGDPNFRQVLGWKSHIGEPVEFYPARILLQDYTGVPCVVDLASMRDAAKKLGTDPERINPEIPVDLVVDHSVQVDEAGRPGAMAFNIKREYERNVERYKLLKWAQKSFDNFHAIPPDTGIIHQINIEHISPVVQQAVQQDAKTGLLCPDTVFGTDSHTTMIGGLAVLGWGVGGLEAEACMLGAPSVFSIPEVVGVRLTGEMPSGAVATDLALAITNLLREKHVVGKFVEYFGSGWEHLSVADRATLANMAPEYGSTCGYSPFDECTVEYLRLTGRSEELIGRAKAYMTANSLAYDAEAADAIDYSEVVDFDLSAVSASLAGPKRPQDIIPLGGMSKAFDTEVSAPLGNQGFGKAPETLEASVDINLDGEKATIRTGDVLIAAITSCTNTSNPTALVAAGLLAKAAVQKGLTVSPKVKTSFAPGSQAVTSYMTAAGLMPYLERLGFNIIAYGCTTCIGNSGPMAPAIEEALKAHPEISAASVLSGNRNFEARIHPLIAGNFLASPQLVVAYAIAGSMRVNLESEPLGQGSDGQPVYLKDIWPDSATVDAVVRRYVTTETYKKAYANIYDGRKEWDALDADRSETFNWDERSTYVSNPPYFDRQIAGESGRPSFTDLTVLAKLGDSVTTDHISPAGAIPSVSPAGRYLSGHGVALRDFNSYGSRRGNHHVMVRGTLANLQLHNQLAGGKQGGYTKYAPTGEVMPIFDACQRYQEDGTGLVILAGRDYGMGSSRDWAAKGVKLLGVRAVIAQSFERIHRSNLAMMGVLPLQFEEGQSAETLGLDGSEQFSIDLPEHLEPRQSVSVIARRDGSDSGKETAFTAVLRLDSDAEISYLSSGGILNSVLDSKR